MGKNLESLKEELAIHTAYTSAVAIDSAGLHDLSEALGQGREVPHGLDRIKRVNKIVNLTTWPEDLKSRSLELKNILSDMIAAFDEEKKEKIRELAPMLHSSYHRLCNGFYDWLLKRNTGKS
ncbi:MAG: hypothetical protein HYU39_03895 [Thaumarchaeota archaeon]|nr:hypothetical protein [Nitrososphaerota archaeon]